jgi:hypothetical protein
MTRGAERTNRSYYALKQTCERFPKHVATPEEARLAHPLDTANPEAVYISFRNSWTPPAARLRRSGCPTSEHFRHRAGIPADHDLLQVIDLDEPNAGTIVHPGDNGGVSPRWQRRDNGRFQFIPGGKKRQDKLGRLSLIISSIIIESHQRSVPVP